MSLTRASAAVIKTEEIVGTRNRIINGAMEIDQRNDGASVTVNSSSAFFGVDRFYGQANGGGVFTMQQSSVAPTGFKNSTAITVTTTDSSLISTDFYVFSTSVEGFNSADFNFGSSSASVVTFSFRVRSSVTGTFSGGLCNGELSRSYPFQFVINSANTWETKTITIVGDTTGTYDTTNGAGLRVYFNLGSGSNRFGTVNTWGVGWLIATSDATNLMATNGATFYVTGVQLEAGSTSTPFERRQFGTELALCQRYFQLCTAACNYASTGNGTTALQQVGIPISTAMRATPTLSASVWYATGASAFFTGSSVTATAAYTPGANILRVAITGFTGLTDNRIFNVASASLITLSSEL